MDRMLLPLVGFLAMLAMGAGGMFAWDRHPAWGVHVPVLWWHVGFDLPAGPVVQAQSRADVAEKAEKVAADGLQACRGKLDGQNAALDLQSQRGAAALAKAQRDLAATRSVNESYRRQASALANFIPTGATQCEAWESADKAVVDALNAKVIP